MSGLLFAFTEFIDKESDMTMVLIGLNTIAGVFAVLGIVLLLQKPIRKVR
jgi:hypothetical protein